MVRFLKKVILILTILASCFGLIAVFDYYCIGTQYKYNYVASIIDKVNRLESITQPKIILVGHSNLAFGIDSKQIEDEIGMPVVNLGLHGGLGNAFHENMAKFGINEGDIVIVCLCGFADEDTIHHPSLAWITIDKNLELWRIIRLKDWPSMLKAYPEYLRKDFYLWVTHTGNLDEGGCYSRNSFNKYGDIIVRPEEDQMNVDEFFQSKKIGVPHCGEACINRLNKYNDYITDRGATMLIAGYPIAYGKYASFSATDFCDFKVELEKQINCDVISDYPDYFYPYDFFYNSEYHLTKEGAEVRTRQLISDIKRWQQRQ